MMKIREERKKKKAENISRWRKGEERGEKIQNIKMKKEEITKKK